MQHLGVVFGFLRAGFEVYDPHFGGGEDDAVGADNGAVEGNVAFVNAGVVGIEESGHFGLSQHGVEAVLDEGAFVGSQRIEL